MVKRVRKTGRKIDVSAELQAVEEAADARQMMEKSADELFMVDTQGSFKGVPKALRYIVKNSTKEGKTSTVPSEARLLERKMKSVQQKKGSKPNPNQQKLTDLWADDEEAKVINNGPAQRGHRVPKSIRHSANLAPAVTIAMPGQSVNPDGDDAKELLFTAAAVQQEQEQRGRRTPMWDDTEEGPLVSSSNSMKAGDEIDPIETKKEVGQPERKTQKQKNKEARHQALMLEHQRRKEARMRQHLKQHPNADLKKLKAEEERLRVRREYINKLKAASLANEAKGIRTRRLKTGRHVFMERGPELGGQSQDSLRRVVPQGSAITERAMAQYRRGKLEQHGNLSGTKTR
ncbi:conserved hypothetical protein [Perkinsus marinus ATCC 50983]|uniref:Ribosome biogenesis protein NOP53 n=1 Tax=Perkinsus marinus (strain ATCC 50983 / TXsc) TaxID=423536 RepID=C5KBC9_PERM5|nr:conserved hypothetical protein [Perkinsus marinus ATCC 50983]EER18455.1 conserved hypothetical protein [Perkinsus marinus ATCC 50983]|eukprot:XP_002786659.1 conserved hypothetical protein [Perkinsus marinus ATCC 50983]